MIFNNNRTLCSYHNMFEIELPYKKRREGFASPRVPPQEAYAPPATFASAASRVASEAARPARRCRNCAPITGDACYIGSLCNKITNIIFVKRAKG